MRALRGCLSGAGPAARWRRIGRTLLPLTFLVPPLIGLGLVQWLFGGVNPTLWWLAGGVLLFSLLLISFLWKNAHNQAG